MGISNQSMNVDLIELNFICTNDQKNQPNSLFRF
jgi:hypothetical protein